MVSQINLGSIYTSGGKTLVGGSASGIDTESLVNGLVEARKIPATKLQDRIDTNVKVTSAYAEIKKNLSALQDAAALLRNKAGVNNASENIFKYRSATVTSNSAVPGSSYLSVTSQPGAPVGSYAVTVDSLATRNVKTTSTFALANTGVAPAVGSGGPFNAGTLTLGASATPITLVAGDSLLQVAAKINASKADTKIEASIIQVSAGNYRLSFKSTVTGADVNYDIETPNAAVLNVGFSLQQDAQNARLTVDGTTVERQNNSIDDLISGMTFVLNSQTPPGTSLALEIDTDETLVKQGITNFVNAYNSLKLFVSKQSALGEDGLPAEDSVLSGKSAVSQIMGKVAAELATSVKTLSNGDPSALAALGITFTDYNGDEEFPFTRNILTINDEKLSSALSTNMTAVQRIFEFQMSTDNANLSYFSNSQALSVPEFSIAADPTNVDTSLRFIASYVDAGGITRTAAFDSAVTATGFSLTGKKGTPFEGLTLLYLGSSSSTSSVEVSQGLGDRMFRSLDSIVNNENGTLALAIKQTGDQSTRLKTEIDRLNVQIERYREQVLAKYSALEASISAANILLQQLAANQSAQEANR